MLVPALLCYRTGIVFSFHFLLFPSLSPFPIHPEIGVAGPIVVPGAQSDCSKRVAHATESDSEREDGDGNSGDTE